VEHEPLSYTPQHLAEKILTSRSALEGERKQVTVLFADVAGFTDLAHRLDPEVVHEVMDGCFAVISAAVHRFEGTINQYTGDGVMALFGAPIAHEDSPRRAVHAALGIQRAMRDFGRTFQERQGLAFQMRIGINTGLVVVGKIGDDLRMDYTAVGDTTNLAARVQQLAQPGTVVISDATSRLVQGFFDTRDLGMHQVKGHPEPVHVVEVVHARGRRTLLEVAAEYGLTPHTGREPDLTTLLERFQQARAGQGQAVFLVGDAGMGKSRHVLEFQQALHAAGETMT
jgi:class 3 adenylate cyclase